MPHDQTFELSKCTELDVEPAKINITAPLYVPLPLHSTTTTKLLPPLCTSTSTQYNYYQTTTPLYEPPPLHSTTTTPLYVPLPLQYNYYQTTTSLYVIPHSTTSTKLLHRGRADVYLVL